MPKEEESTSDQRSWVRIAVAAAAILTLVLFLLSSNTGDSRGVVNAALNRARRAPALTDASSSTNGASGSLGLLLPPETGNTMTDSPPEPPAQQDLGLPSSPTADASGSRKAFTIPHYKVKVQGMSCDAFRDSRGNSLRSTVLPPGVQMTLVPDSLAGKEQPFQLDYLITYVNPFALAKRPREGAPSAQRIRDWNELYWLLRSIFMNGRLCISNTSTGAPTNCLLRTIHIFANGADHVPDWLACRLAPTNATDEEGQFQQFLASSVKVAAHSDVFPGNGLKYNMSFNSNVIELNMHRIQGLSPIYLEFNNDFFLGRPIRFQDVFTPIASESKETGVTSCEVIPITYFKARLLRSDKVIRAEVAEADDPDFSDLKKQSKMFFYFKKFNSNLMLSMSNLPFASKGAIRRADGTTKQLALLQYAHTPTFFDKRSLQWMLRLPLLQRHIKATLERPNKRAVDDVWIPFLYINMRHLARRCQRCGYFTDATRDVTPPIYTFVEYRDAAAIQKTTKSLPTRLSRRPAFVTMNDDVSDDIPALVADPNRLLFTADKDSGPDSAPRCPQIASCDQEVIDKRLKNLKKLLPASEAKSARSQQAVRYLLLLHQFYCKQLWRPAPVEDPTLAPTTSNYDQNQTDTSFLSLGNAGGLGLPGGASSKNGADR